MVKGLTTILIILIPFFGICQDEDYVNPASTTISNSHKKEPKSISKDLQPSYVDSISDYITEKPVYVHGEAALTKTTTNLSPPLYAIQNNIFGTVKIKLILNRDGSIVQTDVIKSLGFGCDEAALKIIAKTQNKWSPAKQYLKSVYDSIIIPLHFKAVEDEISEKSKSFYRKGLKLYKNEKFADAFSFFKVATDLSENYIEALFYSGNCLVQLNRKTEACNYWRKSFDLGKLDDEKTKKTDYCSGDIENKQALTTDSIIELTAVDSVMYHKDFKFQDGIYKTFKEFKFNSPSIKPKEIIVANTHDFFGNIKGQATIIQYKTEDGVHEKLKTKNTWGYCKDGKLHVLLRVYKTTHYIDMEEPSIIVGARYYDLEIIGNIMQAVVEGHGDNYAPPTDINGVPLRGVGHSGFSIIVKFIDFETGESYDNNVENFMKMIKIDQQLFQEYSNIKPTRKKKQMMFIYLKRFNKRNPIYIYKNTYH